MKVTLNTFHLDGHTLGFHPHTLKLKIQQLTQCLILGVKGLRNKGLIAGPNSSGLLHRRSLGVVMQSFLMGEERLRDEPKEHQHRRL